MGAKIVTLANVHSKLLGNSREVYVYLPPSYAESKNRRYPVLYAQDGQHMFASDAKGDSWEMHQTAERLSREGRMEEVIIVAVSSISDQRGSEYFHNHPGVREAFHTTCKGELYERFLIEELKPMIDARFRTLTDREHTAIIGSSAGGLVSYHIAFRRPDVFGQVAILSPFLVHAVVNKQGDGTNKQEPLIEQKVYHSFPVKPPSLRVWVDIGGAEGLIMPRHVRAFVDEMIESGFTPGEDLMFLLDETAGHSQADWARRLHRPLMYLFGEIGRPCSLRLAGRRQVGLEGYRVRLYPKVTYDTGFEMSLLTAEYKVDCPEVLTVGSNGLIVPLASGKADVAVQFGGLTGTANIEVIPELSDHVQVEISVTVPPSTPADAQIHAGFEIPKVRDGFYQGSFLLPRDLAFDVKVSRGFGCHERRKTSRRFDTSEPVRLHFNVEEWEDDSTS
ncbi:alpha/beta hydrolase-fold protein [Paenibacillus phoenicis]|uniref:Alpha/beta hydrolase-fold protein n=1 Tax=Paenibacillus phoenicis TaxID=554117 RepID=A0ABU5PH42_9BACL|nr:alpha/beta hydrolase-fold protein [Paenibacillus phoenicis]MEA3569032.1 alpha/beta hydrolase-fold protein [Paenibacillus phoenicis]